MRQKRKPIRNTWLLALVLGGVTFALSGCLGAAGTGTGSVAVSLNAAATASRAIVPSFSAQIAAFDVAVTDSRDTRYQVSGTGNSLTIPDIFPGTCTLDVTVYADAAKTNAFATGTATVVVVSGETVAAAITLTLSETVAGVGSLSLPLTFPTGLGITAIGAAFDDGAAVVTVEGADYAAGTATVSSASVPSGAYTLALTFYRGSSVVGCVRESVNARSSLVCDRWIDSSGAVLSVRAVTAEELYTSTVSLASLSVGGLSVSLVAGTYEYALTVGALSALAVIPVGSVDAQSLSYAWNGGTSTAILSGAASAPLPTIGVNALSLTVTAPDRSTFATYIVTITRSWTVGFSVLGGVASTAIVAHGRVASVPASPARTGYAFGGWYSDAACASAWDSSATITADTTVYAQMTELGVTRVTLNLERTYGEIGLTASTTVMQGGTVVLTGSLSGTTASSWTWYVDGVAQSGATSSTFSWVTTITPQSDATPEGDHVVSCVAVGVDGVGYSAAAKVTVQPCYRVTYAPNGATGGTVPAQTMFVASATVAGPSTLDRFYYTFVNWNTKADGTGTAYAVGSTYATQANLVLYAQWRLTAPLAVTNLKAYARDSKVTLSWSAPAAIADVDHYEITWKRDVSAALPVNYEDAATITPVPAGTLKYAVTGLVNYTQHGFDVKVVYKEPVGSGVAAGSATATIYAIPGMGKAEVLSMGSNSLAMSYVPAKTVEYAITYGGASQSGTPAGNFLMAQTEMTYRLWYDVYQWATNPARGGKVYTFANAGTPPDSLVSDIPTAATGVMPAVNISWRDALIMCNALTEYYNAINNLSGSSVLQCAYYGDSDCTAPIRSVNVGAIERTSLGSQDCPFVKLGATGFRFPSADEWACASRYIGDFDGDGTITGSNESYPANFPSGGDVDCVVTVINPIYQDYDGNGEVYYLMDVANYATNPTTNNAVGSFKPNMLGLYDMSGNALELLSDWDTNPYTSGSFWGFPEAALNCAYVRGNRSTKANQAYGAQTLRVVRNAN